MVACTERGHLWGGVSSCVVLDLLSLRSLQHVYATWNLGWSGGRGKKPGHHLCTEDRGGGGGGSRGDRANSWGAGRGGDSSGPTEGWGGRPPTTFRPPADPALLCFRTLTSIQMTSWMPTSKT